MVVTNVKAATLLSEIERTIEKGSVYYTDSFRSYNSLHRYGKHLSIDHVRRYVRGRAHINGIEKLLGLCQAHPEPVQRCVS